MPVETAHDAQEIRASRWLRWLNKGSLAILDQGLISGSNFVLSILLARWLTPALYGAYAVAFGIFVLLTLVYGALVLEPMSVFGGAAFRKSLRAYLRSLIWIHLAIAVAVVVGVGAASTLMRASGSGRDVGQALWGVALAAPCILFMWVIRRALYLRMAPGKAISGAVMYCALIFSGLWLLNQFSFLSPLTALLLMGFSALCAGIWLLAFLRATLPHDTEPAPALGGVWSRHWIYGRWALFSSLAAWIPAYIFYPLVTRFSGLAASGELRALNNFVSPLDQTLAALSLLFLPYAARVRAERGVQEFRSLAGKLLALSIGGSALYWLIVVNFRLPIFRLLYSGKYSEVAYLLPAVALGSILWCAAYGPAIALRAMESPKSVFAAFFVTTVVCLIAGTLAARAFGLQGAIWSSNAADLISLVVILSILYSKLGRPRVRELSDSVSVSG
jgi:O-antigen/teichoic acid export membrane protein